MLHLGFAILGYARYPDRGIPEPECHNPFHWSGNEVEVDVYANIYSHAYGYCYTDSHGNIHSRALGNSNAPAYRYADRCTAQRVH